MDESHTYIHHIKPCGMGKKERPSEKREIWFVVIQPCHHVRVAVAMVMMVVVRELPGMQLLYFDSRSERTEANAPQTGTSFVIFLVSAWWKMYSV